MAPSELALETFLDHCLEQAQSTLDQDRKSERVRLTKRVEPNLSTLVTDETKLKQIIDNLLDNAIEFTRLGKISMVARPYDQAVSIAIEDTGIGIRQEELANLFDVSHWRPPAGGRPDRRTGLGWRSVVVWLVCSAESC